MSDMTDSELTRAAAAEAIVGAVLCIAGDGHDHERDDRSHETNE
jgi:hypothetical protein